MMGNSYTHARHYPNQAASDQSRVALLETERLLVIFPGYAAPGDHDPFTDGGSLCNRLVEWFAERQNSVTREHARIYRDFYANPRSPAYMAGSLEGLFDSSDGQRRTLLLGPWADVAPGAAHWANEIRRIDENAVRSPVELPTLKRDHDAVLLMHSDAIGIGLGALERALVAAFSREVFVLNGRGRLYRLDARMRRLLRRRRVIAHTRIIEAVLARLVPIAVWVLVTHDRLTTRNPT
jgi:hypothetical protein